MQRRIVPGSLVLAVLAVAYLAGMPSGGMNTTAAPAVEKAPKKANRPESKVALLIKKVQRPITLDKGIEANTPLRDVLEFLAKEHAVTFVIDTAAFKEDAAEVEAEEAPVKLPKMTNVSLATVLRHLLNQVPPNGGTFLIRRGFIEITTRTAALTEQLVQRQVTAKFDKRPLEEALEELADATGASVLVDGRVADKAKTPITATLKNNLSLEAAVGLLANMADLKAVVIESGLYVTTKENAAALQAEQKQKKPKVFRRDPAGAGA